jgi:hypothetical protein
MAYTLHNSSVFYGASIYPMHFGDTNEHVKTVLRAEDPPKEAILEEITRHIGALSYREVEARAKFEHQPACMNEEGREIVPELFICRGNGFSVVWKKEA